MKNLIAYLVIILILLNHPLAGQNDSTAIKESWTSEIGNEIKIIPQDNTKSTGIEIRGNEQFAYLDLTSQTTHWPDYQGRLLSSMWGDFIIAYKGKNLTFRTEGLNEKGQFEVKSKSVFDHAGQLGIGTEKPRAEIHITDNDGAADMLLESDGKRGLHVRVDYADTYMTNRNDFIGNGTSGNRNIILSSENELVFMNGDHPTDGNFGLTTMKLNYDNQVLIGTEKAVSGYKLLVGGKIIAEELKVKLSSRWPDYVFTKNYNLPDLKEVEQHIQAKGHLPNIPSAEELEKADGFEVSEMTNLQQEKIEEIFLYLIDMKKEIEELKADKIALKQEIELLKKK